MIYVFTPTYTPHPSTHTQKRQKTSVFKVYRNRILSRDRFIAYGYLSYQEVFDETHGSTALFKKQLSRSHNSKNN